MPHIPKKAKVNINGTYRNHSPVFYDDRKGLGYGQLYPTGFNAPRNAGSDFPYMAPDLYEDGEDVTSMDEDELDVFVKKINMGYLPVDSLAKNKTDPFYFVAGNTPGIGGVSESSLPYMKNSIVPFPGWSKKIQAISGGSSTNPSIDPAAAKRTGTEQGYSHAPPPSQIAVDYDEGIGAYRLQDILSDDEMTLAKIEKIMQRIHDQNTQNI
tara:strand:+ start:47423 stop:48055 length:633 start_codon:yes stop_codon:yes gene_type:complete